MSTEHSTENPPVDGRERLSLARTARRHWVLVIVCLLLGVLAGSLYAAGRPVSYTSSARVLVNPAAGNPFVPTPTAVRQDEPTSLETEAQVARSAEVLRPVVGPVGAASLEALQRGLQVTVPPNTQILEISFTAQDPAVARRVADAVAAAYLANRTRRFEDVNASQIDRVQEQTTRVMTDLRTATAASHSGSVATRSFQSQLATALRNELVSLRAQRTALENSDSPVGVVISPATPARSVTDMLALTMPIGGAAGGLTLGLLLGLLLESSRGVVRSAEDVVTTGLPVAAKVPSVGGPRGLFDRQHTEAFDTTVRRLRSTILELEPRPDVIAVAPAGAGHSDPGVSEAVAESFARAGHRVVLVQTDTPPGGGTLVLEEGLAQALVYERLDVTKLLQPTAEPLLCVLAGGFTSQSREFVSADRVRAALAPLVAAGNLVVIQSPGVDSVEGEAYMAAAALGLVVVTPGRTRRAALAALARRADQRSMALAALVVRVRSTRNRTRLDAAEESDTHRRAASAEKRSPLRRVRL